tara:strand:- start:151 stop:342 length:192 start_codon:yes stop_codon:yes gene_type:complete
MLLIVVEVAFCNLTGVARITCLALNRLRFDDACCLLTFAAIAIDASASYGVTGAEAGTFEVIN